EVVVKNRGRLALVILLLDFGPGPAEELDVGADFLVGGGACRGPNDETTGIAAASLADDAAETRTVFGAGDLAGYADVVNRGHVYQEAAGKRDVAGNARALLAERLLGDLHHNFLAGLQHFADELGTARAMVMPVMTMSVVLAMAAVSAAATIEAS